MQMILTPLEDAATKLAPSIAEKLKPDLVQAIRQGVMSPFLTKAKLKDLTGWSDRQIAYKRSRREIPFVQRGRLILFPTDEIIAYLDEGYVPARPRGKRPQ